MSDSEESTKSSTPSETGTGSCTSDDLSIDAEYDDEVPTESAEQINEILRQCEIAAKECNQLQEELNKKKRDLICKIGIATKLLDLEKKRVWRIKQKRDGLGTKIGRASNILFNNENRMPDETRQQRASLQGARQMVQDLNGMQHVPQLSAIPKVNTTGSLLSDFSYSRSEDDLDSSALHCVKTWKKPRLSTEHAVKPAIKKRRSGNSKVVEINATDKVMLTFTPTVSKEGPSRATAIIESVSYEGSAPPQSPVHKAFTDSYPRAPPTHLIDNLWQQSIPENLARLNEINPRSENEGKNVKVQDHLINLPLDCWSSLVNFNDKTPSGKLQQTPSTDSIL